jgi:hypothetical protein
VEEKFDTSKVGMLCSWILNPMRKNPTKDDRAVVPSVQNAALLDLKFCE